MSNQSLFCAELAIELMKTKKEHQRMIFRQRTEGRDDIEKIRKLVAKYMGLR